MAFSFLEDEIENTTGKYDLVKQYFINNATAADITVTWAIKEPEARGSGTYLIRAGERGGPYPQFLAYHILKALVSREMQQDGMTRFYGSAEHRKKYEDKYLVEIKGDEAHDPFIEKIREEERAKILKEMKEKPIAEGGITTSETRRKAIKHAEEKAEEKEEFKGANKE